MKKIVLKLDIHSERDKLRAMHAVSSLSGINSIAMDMTEKKLTVTGDVDPVKVVAKLRKCCLVLRKSGHTEILSVEPEKKEEPKKDAPKKKTLEEQVEELTNLIKEYSHRASHYYVQCAEGNPNSCVTC